MSDAGSGAQGGRLKVYLGFAAGVGKTYTMLDDAHDAVAAGADLVVGYVEPHARPETTALLDGLETVPPREVTRAGATFLDLDLDAVLARRAQIVLVDELAHSNPPGSANAKRYEDVRAILDAGADVWATLNVQHLESLNDQVAAITHVRQRETIPDSFLTDRAAEIVAVDLAPEELRERIRQGKVYPAQRVSAALEGFFRQERLAALRELSLLEMAHLVEGHRLARGDATGLPLADGVAPVTDRLLVLAAGRPGDERVVRQGWRLARSLQCALDVLHVSMLPEQGDADQRMAEVQQICNTLGLPLSVVRTAGGRHGVGEAVAEFARTRRATHVLAGAARDRRLPWRGSTLQEIMDQLPWVDFIVVGDPARWPRRPEEQRGNG